MRATISSVTAASPLRTAASNPRRGDHNGNEYDIFLRLYKKQFVVVVLNGNYHVQYGDLDPDRMYVNSRSTRLAEVKDPDKGLIDFRTTRRGRETYLCWQLGEGDRITYWHDLETGFAGRKLIED